MLNWYAINSKPHSEKLVRSALVARGIETFVPEWLRVSPRAPNRTPRPFFPCYLFAKADLEVVGLSALQYAPGVRRVVFCGDQPAHVRQAEIDEIRRRLAAMEDRITDADGKPLAHGDRVVITQGVFEGWEAIFDKRLSSNERVRLLIDFLQSGTALELDRGWVKKRASDGHVRAVSGVTGSVRMMIGRRDRK